MSSNPTKLTADFTMTRIEYCCLVTKSQFLDFVQSIVIDIKPMFVWREIGCCQLGVYIPLWELSSLDRKIIHTNNIVLRFFLFSIRNILLLTTLDLQTHNFAEINKYIPQASLISDSQLLIINNPKIVCLGANIYNLQPHCQME